MKCSSLISLVAVAQRLRRAGRNREHSESGSNGSRSPAFLDHSFVVHADLLNIECSHSALRLPLAFKSTHVSKLFSTRGARPVAMSRYVRALLLRKAVTANPGSLYL